ncbi:hypothetical protein M514_03336 [Trichuris suis]|uniref:F-box domain-containing protein n=1 Tax=Trichuris suis TaxID=68888 RepID=A0A085NL88_9BILA|nr:hypothetical protein M514_03336 [Trichuris suis]
MSLISSELGTEGTEDSASDSSARNLRSAEVIDADSPELATFRWSWREQFSRQNRQSPSRPRQQRTDEEKNGNDQKSSSAIRIFEAGIAHEREGRMQQAIRCYKQAMKIYPDVEKMVFLNSSVTTGLSLKAIEESGLITSCRRSPDEGDCQSTGRVIKNLEKRLSRNPNRQHCEPNEPQERTHISALPSEVVLQIFRWVISSDLDVQQLEQLSLVCSGFYKLARHPQLWQSICERVWGQRLGQLAPFSSWRDMFINRCRPCFNGLYVAKITYPRMGENSCSSALYRPWHRVVYYRCLRFFPDGTATMMTTADPPQAIVQHLKSKKPKCPTAKVGRYTMEKAEVVQVLQVKSTDRLRDNTLVLTNYEAVDHYVCGKTGPSRSMDPAAATAARLSELSSSKAAPSAANIFVSNEHFEMEKAKDPNRDAILAEFERRKRARHMTLPTDDYEVKALLRQLGHPICLFGEDKPDRRERLRKLLSMMEEEEAHRILRREEPRVEVREEETTWYHEGTEGLKKARLFMVMYSLPKAKERLEIARESRSMPSKEKAIRLQETHRWITVRALPGITEGNVMA